MSDDRHYAAQLTMRVYSAAFLSPLPPSQTEGGAGRDAQVFRDFREEHLLDARKIHEVERSTDRFSATRLCQHSVHRKWGCGGWVGQVKG